MKKYQGVVEKPYFDLRAEMQVKILPVYEYTGV